MKSILRVLASLRLAVLLLAAYAVVLAAATLVESRYGTAAAYIHVYGTRWFTALHVALAVNVFCAMLVRFPWHWRHFGFLLTHGGILVLLAGCLATRWCGIEAMLPMFEGQMEHTAEIVAPQDAAHQESNSQESKPAEKHELELGFQVRLREFRRRLDPGTETPSHYSSRVDFLDRSDPPKTLRKNVTISLNKPVDFIDPRSGRTYRLFQSGFGGPPLKPGDPEFDRLAGSDHSREEIYQSNLSVNYDPGRGLKVAGCVLILVGMAVVFYGKGYGKAVRTIFSPQNKEGNVKNGSVSFFTILLPLLVFPSTAANLIAADAVSDAKIDWSAWRRLPTFGEGRVEPLDTFARRTVEAICGDDHPTLLPPEARRDGTPRQFTAAESLFRWLVEPAAWEQVPFLFADGGRLREELGLPINDAHGRRLRYISPAEVEKNDELKRRWTQLQTALHLQEQAAAEGRKIALTDADKSLQKLINAYGRYRAVTYDLDSHRGAAEAFYDRSRQAAAALKTLIGDLHVAGRINHDAEIRNHMVNVCQTWQKLIAAMQDGDFSIEKLEPITAAFYRDAADFAARTAGSADAPLASLSAELRHQSARLQLSLYDSGETLPLVPALEPGALEENRTPDDEVSPWLGFQAVMLGSDALLQAYPHGELLAVRSAFAGLKAAYVDRKAADRPAKFAAAAERFAASVRALAAAVEPLREKLPMRHRDQNLLDATAYPPPNATDAEVFYNRLHSFFWSWTISLAAVVCLLAAVGRWRKTLFWLGAALLAAGQACTAVGLAFRGFVTGLVPLTGMFETVEFVALYAGLLGLWYALSPLLRGPRRMDRVMERRLFALAGAIVGFTAAVLAYYAPAAVMHRNIGAVQPVLRDNFWLAVHVVTIMASYASAAIALVLGNIALGYFLFSHYRDVKTSRDADARTIRFPPEMCGVLAAFIFSTIRITVLLLTAGIVLGALWADQAWGRFWGWDPKEVWALISLLTYVLVLHAWHVWPKHLYFGMAAASILGFTAVLFTWYVVNFVLPTGLHSYGSGAGGAWAVGGAVAVEWFLLFLAAVRYRAETRCDAIAVP
jgi:ABC-type transport system involved in cytochrome c biogenesis permease subunit